MPWVKELALHHAIISRSTHEAERLRAYLEISDRITRFASLDCFSGGASAEECNPLTTTESLEIQVIPSVPTAGPLPPTYDQAVSGARRNPQDAILRCHDNFGQESSSSADGAAGGGGNRTGRKEGGGGEIIGSSSGGDVRWRDV